jgi:hypothetical protein
MSDDGLRQCRGHLAGDSLDVVLLYLVGWLRHGPPADAGFFLPAAKITIG